MKYAYVDNGVVQEAWGRNPFELFEHGYACRFIECPDHVQSGWLYDGIIWTPPTPVVINPSPEPTKQELMKKLQELQLQINAL